MMNRHILQALSALLALTIVIYMAFFAHLGSVPLFDEDEGAYAEVSREMLVGRDFTTPHLNGQPFFHKPVLFYWTQALSIHLHGLSEFALRLPSALASLLWAMAIYCFTRHYYGRRQGWFAVLFMASSLQITIIGKAAIPDALLNLLITVTMFALYLFYERRQKKHLYLAFLSMGLAVITKGPIGIVIPLTVSFLFCALKKEWKFWLKAAVDPLGLSILCLIALPWYAIEYQTHGQKFVNEMFIKHNLNRFQAPLEGHSGSLFYYVPIVLLGLLPNTAFLIKAVARVKKLLAADLGLFLILWFAVVFVFFSIAQTKLHHYIVYGYTPLFILMALNADHLKHRLNHILWPLGFLVAFFFVPDIIIAILPHLDDDFTREVLSDSLGFFDLKYRLILGGALLLTTGLALVKRLATEVRTTLLAIIFLGLVNLLIIPIVGEIQQRPVKEAALLAEKNGYDVIVWKMNYPSFNVYRQALTEDRSPNPGDIILTRITTIESVAEYEIYYQKHGIVLARVLRM